MGMVRRGKLLVVAVVLACMCVAAPASAFPVRGQGAAQAPVVLAGAASRSVLPLVDGSYGYLDPERLPEPTDPVSPGLFVPEWDAGRIAVGNGASDAHWVHDDLRVRALALQELRGGRDIVVLLASDLYMIFRLDAAEIRRKARDLLPPGLATRVEIIATSTHNHHGPDTAFDVNHTWYDHMTDQAAAAVAEAVQNRRPATLRVGRGEHWFGVVDGRDPQIIDPSMNVLQARATNGSVIGTVVQWNNHPETTLFWEPPGTRPAECRVLGEEPGCPQDGRYITADYAGVLSKTIEHRVGGVALYFNSPLGGLTTPLGAPVWEITDEVGLGNQYDPPPGAVPAGGEEFSFVDKNFRRAHVIGRQAALAALRFLNGGQFVADAPITYDSEQVFTRLTHIGFRTLLVVDEDTGRSSLGHNPAMLYTCPSEGPKTEATCEPDGFETVSDPVVGTVRAGDHLQTVVGYLRIGPVGMAFVPGELLSELAIGLPAGFVDQPGKWFAGPLSRHAAGGSYDLPGYLRDMMRDEYEWVIGLGNDELGYIIPISDWRVACVADRLSGESGRCERLHEEGFIDYPDAVSGRQCKAVTDDSARLGRYPQDVARAIAASCRYGQVLGEPADHYEETNSAGWDLAADLLGGFATLTGHPSDAVVNPDFPGYWRGMPPPAS